MIRLLVGLVLALASVEAGSAQSQVMWHKLAAPSQLYHDVVLPPSAFVVGDEGLYDSSIPLRPDVRIYGVQANGDTLEVPFVWRQRSRERPSERRVEPLSTERLRYGMWRYTFEVDSLADVGTIRLIIDSSNVEALASVGTSQQLDTGYSRLTSGSRILAVNRPDLRYRYTTIQVGATGYRYYRLTVIGIEAAAVKAMAYAPAVQSFGTVSLSAKLSPPDTSSLTASTVLQATLAEPQLIDEVQLYIGDTATYVRAVRIEPILDSSPDTLGGGVREVLGRATKSTVSVVAPNVIALNRPVVARAFRITIANGDLPALHIDSVRLSGREVLLVARFDQPTTTQYYLTHGHLQLPKPKYDANLFAQELPATLPRLVVGPGEVKAASLSVEAEPRIKWSYLVVAALLIGLGYVLVRGLRSVNN